MPCEFDLSSLVHTLPNPQEFGAIPLTVAASVSHMEKTSTSDRTCNSPADQELQAALAGPSTAGAFTVPLGILEVYGPNVEVGDGVKRNVRCIESNQRLPVNICAGGGSKSLRMSANRLLEDIADKPGIAEAFISLAVS